MLHEKTEWQDSSFITLTYDDANLPPSASLRKKDLQDFWKRLRKLRSPIKYYACGEYGEQHRFNRPFGRPHYHAIVYGVGVSDQDIVDAAWKKGRVHVGVAEPDSIRYVAQYVDKKIYGPAAKEHYNGCEQEFQLCSKGIGRQWMEKNQEELLAQGFTTFRMARLRVPRYYEKRLSVTVSKDDWEKYKRRKEKDAMVREADWLLAVSDGFSGGEARQQANADAQSIGLYRMKEVGEQMHKNLIAKAKVQQDRRRKSL